MIKLKNLSWDVWYIPENKSWGDIADLFSEPTVNYIQFTNFHFVIQYDITVYVNTTIKQLVNHTDPTWKWWY